MANAKHPRGTKLIVVSRDGLAEGNREDFRGMLDAGYDFKIFKALGDLQANNRWRAYVSHSVDGWGRPCSECWICQRRSSVPGYAKLKILLLLNRTAAKYILIPPQIFSFCSEYSDITVFWGF